MNSSFYNSVDMQDIPETTPNITRPFDVFEIKWKIDYFNLASCPDNWSIQSPEFTLIGSDTTKWFMRVESETNEQNNAFVFILQRCNLNTGPNQINVNWRLNACNQNNYKFYVLERFYIFDEGTWIIESLNDCKDIVDIFNSAENEFLTFRLKMILYTNIAAEDFKPSNHKGKRSLSENLMNLLNAGFKCDLALHVGDRRIMVHKAIMCSRIKKIGWLIAEEINNNRQNVNGNIVIEEMDVLNLSNFKYSAVESLVKYAYSGDLVHVLLKPSLAIYDIAKFLYVSSVMIYFEAKKLAFSSYLNVRKIKLKWEIVNFSLNCNYTMESPTILDVFSTQWQVVILLHSCLDYFSAFVNVSGQVNEAFLSLEIAVISEFGNSAFKRKFRSSTADLTKLGFEKFIRRDLLERLSRNNTLRMRLKVKLTDGIMFASEIKYNPPVLESTSQINSFDLLSIHMLSVYDNSDFSDLELIICGLHFKVHRCILATTSNYFADLLDRESDFDVINIPNIEPGVTVDSMAMLLSYLYSGVVEAREKKHLEELKQAALSCDLPVLNELCDEELLKIE